jgi:HK97 family phage major capsid protein
MTTLNSAGRSNADKLVDSGKVDKTSAWSFSAADGDALLGKGGDDWANYGMWFLGIHGEEPEKTKAHYGYPFGKGGKVYRSAIIAIKQRAAGANDDDIASAAGALLDDIDGKETDKEEAAEGSMGSKATQANGGGYGTGGLGGDAEDDEQSQKSANLKKLNQRKLRRLFTVNNDTLDAAARTVELSFSSEYPVDRWFGTEVLDHSPGAARMGRLNSGAPLLFNHNADDVIGVVEAASIGSDRRGHALARFAKNARGQEIMGMVQDGILSNSSFTYQIHAADEDPKRGTIRATDWEPAEISIVSVPADPTVGIGRAWAVDEDGAQSRQTRAQSAAKGVVMAEQQTAAAAGNETAKPIEALEQERRLGIENLCKGGGLDSRYLQRWLTSGMSLGEVANEFLKVKEEQSRSNQQSIARLDLSNADTKQYSLLRAVLAATDRDWSKAGFEAECSRTIAERLGTAPDSTKFYVPLDIQRRALNAAMMTPAQQRALTVASGSGGGYLVETENLGFIEVLRNRAVAYRMGATRLAGLVGSVNIPKQSAAATAYWLTNETTTATTSAQTFAQVPLSPKNVAAYTEISRQLALQSSPDAETIVMSDLAAIIAIAVDKAALAGTGAPQPQGIIGTSGVGSVTGTSIAWAGIIQFETDVLAANAMVNPSTFGYVATPAVMGLLKQRQRFSNTNTPLWVDGANPGDGLVNGYRAMASMQLPTGDLLAGDFSQVVIAEWGVLEVGINPYASFAAGVIGIRAIYSCDVGVRWGASFDLATTVT